MGFKKYFDSGEIILIQKEGLSSRAVELIEKAKKNTITDEERGELRSLLQESETDTKEE